MTDFLIKSTLCLFVLLAVYHWALEKEKMHQFNRFYLLFSIAFSFAIPFITIEVINESKKILAQPNPVITAFATVAIIPQTVNYTPIILWSIYGLITPLLLFRFIRNILKITSRTQANTVIDYKKAKLVLLKEKTLPHTFWNNIFINETDYHNRKIEEELYTHELIHVTQKHTLDVLLIEIVKTVFWFNPIFIFYKKAIQLNHEFLADEKVVNSYNNVPFYQTLLLSKANENQPFYLASNLNYLVTKKRLIMMTKNKSKTKETLKKLALLPLLSGIVCFSCLKTVAQEKTTTPVDNKTIKEQSTNKRRDAYYAGVRVIIHDYNNHIEIDKKYEDLTLEEKEKYTYYDTNEKEGKFISTKLEMSIGKNKSKTDSIKKKTYEIVKIKNKDYFKINQLYFDEKGSIDIAGTPQKNGYILINNEIHFYIEKNGERKYYSRDGRIVDSKGKTIRDLEIDALDIDFKNENLKNNPLSESTDIYNTAGLTERPDFPGGMDSFYKFIGENYRTPEQPNLKGKVYVTFIIEKDGSLTDIKNIRDIGYGTGDEAIRVLKLCPKWTPGKMEGIPVRVMYSLPITLQSAK